MKKLIAAAVVLAMALTLSIAAYGATAENPLQVKKLNAPLTIDGVIEPEWGDPVIVNTGEETIKNFLEFNGVSSLEEYFINSDGTVNAAPTGGVISFGDLGGLEDLKAREAYLKGIKTTTYLRWDDQYLYIATDIEGMGTSHHNVITDPANIWGQDNVQYMISDITFPYSNGNIEVGFAMNSETSELMKYKWADNLGTGFDNTIFAVKKSTSHFIYEVRMPWVEVGLEAAIAEGMDFAFNECFNFSVPASKELTANPDSNTATRAAIESYHEGGILNGKNAMASFPAKLVAAPVIEEVPEVEETPEEVDSNNPATADTMLAAWSVLAAIAAMVAFVTIRKFCK